MKHVQGIGTTCNCESADRGGGTGDAAKGLGGLKTRELAQEIGVANGGVYNLVEDVDELILRVGSRTLARLDASLSLAEIGGAAAPREMLVRIAVAYCDFAAENLELWRALFEHRMQPGKPVPEWAITEQMELFRHIYKPLAALFPALAGAARRHRAQPVLRRAWHGRARLEHKLTVPIGALRSEISTLTRAMVDG